jgi:RNA polymerase sporulation-specific sigma factor
MRDLAYKAMALKEKMLAQKGANVTNAELAKELDVPVNLIDAALEATQDPVSIFEPVFRDGNDTLYVKDQISDISSSEEKWSEKIALQEALTKLDKREYNIINMRYFLGKTQMEIAEEIGISQAQVSRLEKGALERMRKYM